MLEPQTADGKVLWHFTMSLDGFVAGPGHGMDWMTGTTFRPDLVGEYAATTGAVLGGRDGWDAYPDPGAIYGGAWTGPLFVLTHHPEDATPTPGVTFLNCGVEEAVRIGLEAATGSGCTTIPAGRRSTFGGSAGKIRVRRSTCGSGRLSSCFHRTARTGTRRGPRPSSTGAPRSPRRCRRTCTRTLRRTGAGTT
ncbi:dihydrofolate reductase family protein [Amycolatopsis keratiniphila]|uniref:dihydrofolate reductase family protein n=1 Tax=Amycolatopsis keratiniphila TaxID=129921 RepID=UPI001E33FA2F|nr:dihydrofolate reductase family protein [Amycolatopsis keratiniphila]